jgi:glutamate dehydrogenase/leucine dehydrogenase
MTSKPHLIRELKDERSGLIGYLVIDTLVAGRSCGGVRMVTDVTLSEVKALARAMTLKYGFLGDPTIGGAKAGIAVLADCPAEKKTKILQSFGRQIAPSLKSKQYIPWTDMHAGPGEIATILRAAGVRPGSMPDSAYTTALSVFGSIQAACRFKHISLPEITVAIEGFGRVGSSLAGELAEAGAKIVAVSTRLGAVRDRNGLDIEELVRTRKIRGDDFIRQLRTGKPIDKRDLLELDVDVLVPAARPDSIHEKNAGRLRARIIAPAANNPITAGAEAIIHASDILSVPDFVANTGGIYGSRLQGRMSPERIHRLFLGAYSDMVFTLLRRAQETGLTPRDLAERIAKENRIRIRENEARNTSGARRLLRGAALGLLDSPLTPNHLVDGLLYRWAQRDLSSKVK